MVRKALLLTVAAVSTFVAGCSGGVEGSATADRPAADDPFDPCSIPDDVISAAGLDPASGSSMSERGYELPDWSVCTWIHSGQPSWYFFSVSSSSSHTIEEVRRDQRYSDVSEMMIGDREFVRYKFNLIDLSDSCDLAYQSASGLIKLSVRKKASFERAGEMCDIVRDHAGALAPSLPPS